MRATKTSDANPYNFKKLLPLAVIGLVAVAAFIGLKDYLSFNALRENRAWLIEWRDQNYVLAALSYIGVYVAAVAFSVPGALVITLAGGFLFGLFAGTFFTVIGATIGATTIFLAAKYGLGDRLFEKLKGDGSKGMISKLEAGLREDEVSYLFLMRLVPAFPFFVLCSLPFWALSLAQQFTRGSVPGLAKCLLAVKHQILGSYFNQLCLGQFWDFAHCLSCPLLSRNCAKGMQNEQAYQN